MEIVIISKQFNGDELKKRLQSCESQDVKLVLSEPKYGFHQIEPTVLIAIVSVLSTALDALISGLLNIAKQSQNKKSLYKIGMEER